MDFFSGDCLVVFNGLNGLFVSAFLKGRGKKSHLHLDKKKYNRDGEVREESEKASSVGLLILGRETPG